MPARLYIEQPLHADTTFSLPPGPARHAQVLRLQPGAELTLFNGEGGEWRATVQQMGRSEVQVTVHEHDGVDRELPRAITLAIGMPANERMDALIEKATELGVAAIQPLLTERSVLRLSGERAERRLVHWQGVAVAASEQSGRTRVPQLAPVRALAEWLRMLPAQASEQRCLLSPRATQTLASLRGPVVFLSGPEGGLSDGEEALAATAGFHAIGLGPRVLRADTAPLAVLAHLALSSL
ncbi:MAG TPA: 16S rRNA (uracil(1498)-N(3))-methyltransferase [Rhizobacter sp.]|jgi:16S rRNA (uracil1498-N3)-methyltransferase|nr:16S rRNA (uracil(1498)-N(3))-methyltransferase [Rhizobacter sp.]